MVVPAGTHPGVFAVLVCIYFRSCFDFAGGSAAVLGQDRSRGMGLGFRSHPLSDVQAIFD